jgi:hypothetical protein
VDDLSARIGKFLDGDAPHASATTRVAAGAMGGAVFAAFALVSAAAWLVVGPVSTTRGGVRVRWDLLTVGYPLGAVLGGALLGFARPCVRPRPLAALFGLLALLPLSVLLTASLDGAHRAWSLRHTVLALVTAAVLGGGLGWTLHAPAAARAWQRRRPEQSG